MGFEVTEPFSLPFAPDKTDYTSYWRGLAQIQYSSGDRTAVFRKSPGTEDNSGDYSTYDSSAEIAVNGQSVTLRGDGEAYVLAVWTDGTFSCSLRLSLPASEGEWCEILRPGTQSGPDEPS